MKLCIDLANNSWPKGCKMDGGGSTATYGLVVRLWDKAMERLEARGALTRAATKARKVAGKNYDRRARKWPVQSNN